MGNHRIRIGGAPSWTTIEPCYNGVFGSFEDYTINVTPPTACAAPVNPVAVVTANSLANLSWEAPNGTTSAGYEYTVTTTTTIPTTGTAVAGTTVTGAAFTLNRVNYLYVRINCGNGTYSPWVAYSFYSGICRPQPLDTDGEGITNFTIGTINNTTTGENGGYADYSAQAVNIQQGVEQSFSYTLNTNDTGYDVKIWADWNDDLDFDDEGEELYASDNVLLINTGSFTVPMTAAVGNHRLRIGGVASWNTLTPCYSEGNATFEDYTITVTNPPACFIPTGLTGTGTQLGFANISWQAPLYGSAPAGYDYAVSTSSAPPAAGTTATGSSVTGVTVTPNAYNYLHVRTNCSTNGYSEWTTLRFYSGHCLPSSIYLEYKIVRFSTTNGSVNITNNTQQETDFTNYYDTMTVAQEPGANFNYSVTINSFSNVDIWADWNNDLDFDDEGELVASHGNTEFENATFTGMIGVPGPTPQGSYRMRVRARGFADATPCGETVYGTAQDYKIEVTAPPACYAPINVSGVAIGAGNANLTWQAQPLGTTPVGYEYFVSASAISPQSGIATTATSVTGFDDFDNDIFYYLHVRTNCGNGNFSLWTVSEAFRFIAGDICETAIDLATLTSPLHTTTIGATDDYVIPCHDWTGTTNPDLFYSIVVPSGYTLNIGLTAFNNNGSESNAFYGSCDPEDQTPLFCNWRDLSLGLEWENLTGSDKTVYWIQDGGTFTLEWSLTVPACDIPRGVSANPTSLTTANISWTAPLTGSPEGYEYTISQYFTPPDSGTFTSTLSVTGVPVTPNIASYLHVRSLCGVNGTSNWVTYAFYSGYCTPSNTTSTAYYISNVSTSGGELNFSNTTRFSGYTDYSLLQAVTTYAGGSFNVTARHEVGNYAYTVWIDWNNDFDFEDAGEMVLNTQFMPSPVAVGLVTVPLSIAQGRYRMRIRNSLTNTPVPVCGNIPNGEAEDYTVIVGPAPTCFIPYGLTIAPQDATTADVSWSPPILGTLPQGYEYVVSTSETLPAGSGIPTQDIYIYGVEFNPAVSTYLYVRTNCGDGDFSAWAGTAILDAGAPQLPYSNVLVYKEGNAIHITCGSTLITGVAIYDIRGSKLYAQTDINAAQAAITGLQIQQQVLIVEVTTAKGKVSKRIVF